MLCFSRRAAAKINRHAGLSVQRTYLYRASKPEGWAAPAPNGATEVWEVLPPERVGQLRDIGAFDANDRMQRLHSEDLCYMVRVGGRLAHFSWVQRSGRHTITEAGVSMPVGNGELWIYNCRTAEWARGRKIYPATLARIVADHFEAGYSAAWIYTSRENVASQKGILRAGFSQVATLTALRVGTRYYRMG